MGRHNIDTEFGQKLRSREITPKAGSWEKLNSRLEKDTKKSGSYKWMLGIAASFVAGLLILGQFYRMKGVEETPSVVNSPVEIQKEVQIIELRNSRLAVEEVQKSASEERILNENPIDNTPAVRKETISQKVYGIETPSEETEVAEVSKEEIKENLPAGLAEVIASVSSNLANNDDLAEAEVDSLLMMAASRISRERTSYLAGESIDASSLLWDVEMEMEQSFREKVFDIMKEGYLKARTAVANRNY